MQYGVVSILCCSYSFMSKQGQNGLNDNVEWISPGNIPFHTIPVCLFTPC